MVILRYHHIHQSPTLVATAVNEQRIRWRDKDDGYEPNVLRQSLVLLLVPLEVLLRASLHATVDRKLIAIARFIGAFYHEEVLLVVDHLRINSGEGTTTERQIVDRIEQVGLTFTVMPDEAVDLSRQFDICRQDILIIDD